MKQEKLALAAITPHAHQGRLIDGVDGARRCGAASVHQARQIQEASELLEAYDYVIVGGGTAGLTVADRLTEDPATTVLVLEAGVMGDPAEVLPATAGGSGWTLPAWKFQSVPQANLGGRTSLVWLGNVVGGGSAVNAMMAARGSAEDYDRWGRPFGDDDGGWNWEGILPYFKKGLKMNPPPADLANQFNISIDAANWGTDSPVQVGFPSFQYPGLKPLVKAFTEMPGVEFVKDSGAGGAGVYWFPTLMDPNKVERSYAGNAHYSNLDRPNYHLMVETTVRRAARRHHSHGRRVYQGGSIATVEATREVLIAAGAIHTAKVLMLSGIGPREAIEAAGQDTVVDLPGVGQNFQDHANLGAAITLAGLKQIHPNPDDLGEGGDAKFQRWSDAVWAANRTRARSIAYGNIAGWLPLTAISPDRHEALAAELEAQDHAAHLPADAHPTVAAGYAAQMKGLAAAMRSKNTVFARYALNAATGATAPSSTSPSAAAPWPWTRATPLAPCRSSTTAPSATPSRWPYRRLARHRLRPSDLHPVGTAAMLPLELGGVVDTTLRVYGVDNLRVVDSSIMPSLPGGNTCQPTYAIAEKAADIIKSGV
ncbi:hypothetical protein MCOR01_002323 [Pyricularia oryzae]|nr:hypothetical protein MCOR01_002323 [Pyricularia oryzae]